MNEKMGLPFGDGMQKTAFCFDIDGTLIDDETKHANTMNLLLAMGEQKWKNVKLVVWSGRGAEYAVEIVRKYGLEDYVDMTLGKDQYQELRDKGYKIVAIDDIQNTRLGDVNLIVRNK